MLDMVFMKQTFSEKKARHKRNQLVYDAIAALRRGETVTIWGRTISPFTDRDLSDLAWKCRYVHTMLFKHRNRIRLGEVCFKDSWPNPKIINAGTTGRVQRKHLYGIVAIQE
jgi:hypothetical protein